MPKYQKVTIIMKRPSYKRKGEKKGCGGEQGAEAPKGMWNCPVEKTNCGYLTTG